MSLKILRNTITNLHQESKIDKVEVIDEYEPLEQGLTKVEVKRTLPVLEIKLSKRDGVLNEKSIGY